ncbi:MAG: hypothetical protein LC781_15100, partial [Actinobacteria bacterium]|nr:hypothetical protein [Actinomycetota bacterium]
VMLVAFAAPAMAQGNGNNNDRQLDQHDVRLDRQLLNDNDHQGFFGTNDDRNQIDEFGFFPFADTFFPGFFAVDQGCPFWGDTSGVVNQWDCVE